MSRAYSDETWDLYAQLDQSLDPAGPESLHDVAAEFIAPGSTILDAGCRDAAHLIPLVTRHGATGVGIEPVAIHVEMARAAAGLGERVEIVHGGVEALAYPGRFFDLIWCRDVLEQVEPLAEIMRSSARVLRHR